VTDAILSTCYSADKTECSWQCQSPAEMMQLRVASTPSSALPIHSTLRILHKIMQNPYSDIYIAHSISVFFNNFSKYHVIRIIMTATMKFSGKQLYESRWIKVSIEMYK